MAQREVGPDYQRWISKLMAYDFEIKYKPGPSNRVADPLSRQFAGSAELGALITAHVPTWADIQQQVSTDPFIQQLTKEVATRGLQWITTYFATRDA